MGHSGFFLIHDVSPPEVWGRGVGPVGPAKVSEGADRHK